MIKTSVKRPFLILVLVIMCLVLGAVAFVKMKTDLLPSINLPYVAVITTYPGAPPERVESEVSEPLENTLGVINGVESIQSQSGENFSMIFLEFSENTDMAGALAKISQSMDQLTFPEMVGKPIVMEISSDMLATMYAGVTKDGENIVDLTEFVNDKIVPEIKRIDGVASVSTTGDVTESVEIRLDQKKIDAVNKKVLKKVNSKLADALDKITDGEAKLKDGKSEIKSQKKKLEKTEKKTTKQLATATKGLNQAIATKSAYESQVASIKAQIAALEAEKKGYSDGYDKINEAIKQFKKMQPDNDSLPSDIDDAFKNPDKLDNLVEMLKAIGQDEAAKGFNKETINMLVNAKKTRIPQIDTELANGKTKLLTAEAVLKNVKKALKAAESNYEKVEQGKMSAATQFGAAYAGLNSAESTLKQSEEELKNAKKTYEDSLDTARKNANINSLLEMDTLAQILSAQNFDMPAGYISDDKTQYLLKVGKEFESLDELKNLVLMKMDGVGDVKISDVAYVTIINDSINKYAKIGDDQAVVLSITKSSTAFTSEVSDKCNETMKDLEKRYKGVNFEVVMDQGEYIDVIVDSVLSNLVYGAGLAVIVLLFFLMDWRPTVIIAISIPLSVMFAVVLMYFTNITFNVISLSGLALGIGMLVDNSVVSIENIYRLRAEGVPAARAAVYGAKQIAAAITASTITTICVFLPILFTDGLTRELMMDMCLTITFSLVASLIVALTVVPTMSATFFRNSKEKDHRLFEHFLNGYEKVLRGCLKVKVVPILVAIILLVLCTYKLVTMGIIIFPEMGSERVSVDVKFNPEYENEEIIEFTDKMLEELKDVEGVDKVGAMAQSGAMQLYGISGVDEGDLTSMSFFCQLKEGYGHKNTKIAKKIEAMMEKDERLEDYTVQASDMDMGSMLGSGLSIKITGNDTDKLLSISEDVMDILKGYEGFEEVSNGQEEGDDQINIIVDKNKAARLGLTVAQVYQEILKGTTTDKDAITLNVDDKDYQVTIVNENDEIDIDNLMDYKFETKTTNDDGEEETEEHKLSEFAKKNESKALVSINRDNQSRYINVTAKAKEGYNVTLLSRDLKKDIKKYKVPDGYNVKLEGETESVDEIVKNMLLMIGLGFLFIYLVMVAQFQSLLSPFIVIFTVPLAFTGGMIGLMIFGEQLSLVSMMGFLILMGVVVNNGIVFVDYVNQLRIGGASKKEALVEAGRTRMRPILMTAMTTILAMSAMIFSKDIGSDMGRGMAIVVASGLIYATLMTVFIVPVLYDIFFRRDIRVIDVGDND